MTNFTQLSRPLTTRTRSWSSTPRPLTIRMLRFYLKRRQFKLRKISLKLSSKDVRRLLIKIPALKLKRPPQLPTLLYQPTAPLSTESRFWLKWMIVVTTQSRNGSTQIKIMNSMGWYSRFSKMSKEDTNFSNGPKRRSLTWSKRCSLSRMRISSGTKSLLDTLIWFRPMISNSLMKLGCYWIITLLIWTSNSIMDLTTIGKLKTCGKEMWMTQTLKSGKRTSIKGTKLGNKKVRRNLNRRSMQRLRTMDLRRGMVSVESQMVPTKSKTPSGPVDQMIPRIPTREMLEIWSNAKTLAKLIQIVKHSITTYSTHVDTLIAGSGLTRDMPPTAQKRPSASAKCSMPKMLTMIKRKTRNRP